MKARPIMRCLVVHGHVRSRPSDALKTKRDSSHAQADLLAGAGREEKTSACSVRNDVRAGLSMVETQKRAEAPDDGNSESNDEGQTDHALRRCSRARGAALPSASLEDRRDENVEVASDPSAPLRVNEWRMIGVKS
jgi:hypothetical protein